MLTGLPPFYTTNRDELFDRIKYETLVFPKKINPVLRNLLEGLFQKNPNQRIGGSDRGAMEIKSHKWFEGFDWDALRTKTIPPPFVPVLKSDIDVSYFDPVRKRLWKKEKESFLFV
jgi:serum/glucocorticoid-regulated kinase 2